ncbi:MAG: nucleoside/nucleotide kinase family protein [Oscillospiraceae bacterium]|nr:nucleoside/nucleotide kinase family protein [Oscillospiraceae bacterium]
MSDDKAIYNFSVNSFNIKAEYHKRDIDGIFIPLAKKFDELRRNLSRRAVIYLAGPCGAGKTTLSLLLESLTCGAGSFAQALGMDGFHYHSGYLAQNYICKNGARILLRDIKGAAETYDFEKLYQKTAALRHCDIYWPGYDRTIHDAVEDVTFVNGQIAVIEGNWLLLDELPWQNLAQFCDYSIFVSAGFETLVSRLTERKIMGGLDPDEAKKFVMRSDVENIRRISGRRQKCDLELQMKADGSFAVV